MKGKKLWILIGVVLALAAAGAGAWFYFSGTGNEPIYVYPFHYIGMTEYWGDSQESYGPVSTDKIQTVFLSDTQEVTEIAVKQGDTVKKGDLLISFDTTLSDLQLERKRLAVEKLKLQLQQAEEKLREINNMVPVENLDTGYDSYYDENLGPMISGQGYQILENPEYNGSSEFQPLILWLSNSQGLNPGILADAEAMAQHLQTMVGTPQEDGSVLYQPPVMMDGFYAVVRVTENDQQYANLTVWQGLWVSTDDYSMVFHETMVGDPMCWEDDRYYVPSEPQGTQYTAAQIDQMRSETQKKIKDLNFQLKMADAEYKIMLTEITDGNVYAEIDGEVVSLLDQEEAKKSKQPLIKVSGGGGFYVEGYVNELEKDNLTTGMTVTVNDWYTGNTYEGTIASVGDFPTQEESYNGMGNPNSSYYPFQVFVDGTADLKADGYASIVYSGGEGEAGIYLENPFLRTEGGKTYVMVRGADGTLEQRSVVTGKALWGSYTEIKSGVSPEDYLAFPYGKQVKIGAKTVEGDLSNLYG